MRYSGKLTDSGKIKPHIIFQGYLEKEKDKNYKDEKKKLHFSLRTKTFQSEREMFEYVENLVIANEDLRNIIKQSVKNQYKSMSISLKTFWIINYEVISKKGIILMQCAERCFIIPMDMMIQFAGSLLESVQMMM